MGKRNCWFGYIFKDESRIFPDGTAMKGRERWVVLLCKQEKVQIERWGKGTEG